MKKAGFVFHLQVPAAPSIGGDRSAPEEEAAKTRPTDLVSFVLTLWVSLGTCSWPSAAM